ncbi:MAG: hypothetical protein K7J46_16570 [Bryobacter sp.]|nr:hypothetical protein [Bryobacter sp. CoA8 C33]
MLRRWIGFLQRQKKPVSLFGRFVALLHVAPQSEGDQQPEEIVRLPVAKQGQNQQEGHEAAKEFGVCFKALHGLKAGGMIQSQADFGPLEGIDGGLGGEGSQVPQTNLRCPINRDAVFTLEDEPKQSPGKTRRQAPGPPEPPEALFEGPLAGEVVELIEPGTKEEKQVAEQVIGGKQNCQLLCFRHLLDRFRRDSGSCGGVLQEIGEQSPREQNAEEVE